MTGGRGLPDGAALVVLGTGGLRLAATLKPLLPGSDIHGLEGRAEGADVVFSDTASHLRGLFAQSRPIVQRRSNMNPEGRLKFMVIFFFLPLFSLTALPLPHFALIRNS